MIGRQRTKRPQQNTPEFHAECGFGHTAEIWIDTDKDDEPYAIGVLDPDGNPIFCVPERDTVRFGFHPPGAEDEDYDED